MQFDLEGHTLLSAALTYAVQGLRVVPLHTPTGEGCSCRRAECSSVGKHPRIKDWTELATTDATTIQAWWDKHPHANIGIATGAESGVFVVDVDGDDGETTIRELQLRFGKLPPTREVRTGNGRHLYFRHPGDPLPNSVKTLGKGLDIRADGGQVVAPPSRHRSGIRYEWANSGADFAPAPQWLLNAIHGGLDDEDEPSIFAGTHECESFIPKGKRNDTLFTSASSLRGKGATDEEVLESVIEMNETLCSPPLPSTEVLSIAKSVSKYEPGKKPTGVVGMSANKNPLYWMQFDVQDALTDVRLMALSDAQFRARFYLWLEAWRAGGTLPTDTNLLFKLSRASSREEFAVDLHEVLYGFILVEQDGGEVLVNEGLRNACEVQLKKYKQKCDASQKGVEAKRAKKQLETGGEDDSWSVQ